MAWKILDFLMWVALALLLIGLGEFYKPTASHVAKPALIAVCLIIASLAVHGWTSGKTPREILQGITISGYLRSGAFLAGAVAWGFLTVHVLGLGIHFFGAFFVAVPCLGLLVAAGNIAFLTFYRDLGFGSDHPKKTKKKNKKASARA